MLFIFVRERIEAREAAVIILLRGPAGFGPEAKTWGNSVNTAVFFVDLCTG